MGSILALLVIVAFALWIVQVGTIALRMTGLDDGTARFQAMSAFFGVGYTTNEAEMIVNHPVRRRIISHLIIAGNIGLTSALGTVVVTFVQDEQAAGHHPVTKLGLIVSIVLGVFLLARFSPRIELVERLVRHTLRRSGYVRPTDYEVMLRIHDGYGVGEVHIPSGHWLTKQTLAEARPSRWSLLIIGVTRASGEYIPAPGGETTIEDDDTLAIYGPVDLIRDLSEKPLPSERPATAGDGGGTID